MKRKNIIISSLIAVPVIILCITMISAILMDISRTNEWLKKPKGPGKVIHTPLGKKYVTMMGKGFPTVIIESGLGNLSLEWNYVQREIAKVTRVITYDRAGYGWSEELQRPRTSMKIARELYALLKIEKIKGPIILVGQSIGALYAQHYTHLHPNQIKGVLLINPITVDYPLFRKKVHGAIVANFISQKSRFSFARFLSSYGLIRLLNIRPYEKMSPSLQSIEGDLISHYSSQKIYTTAFSEYGRGLSRSIKKLTSIKAHIKHPITVITTKPTVIRKNLLTYKLPYKEIEKIIKIRAHAIKNLTIYSQTKKVIYSNESKYLHIYEPDVIIKAIKGMIRL